jgi:hypothetical protein
MWWHTKEWLFISKSNIFARRDLEFAVFLKSSMNERCAQEQLTLGFMMCLAIFSAEIKINYFNIT